MYNPQLETFIRAADLGSFNKAAEELFVTPTAVIKQINLLEDSLGMKLFDRTHRGLKLTKAGASMYRDAKYIINYCRESVLRAKKAELDDKNVIRIGTSPMTPAQLLTDLWPQIHKHCSDVSFQLVPFENTPENAKEILKNLGEHIDVVTGIFDETLLDLRQCAGFEISKEPICCALSIYHPLAGKNELTAEDLYGENLMIIHRGWSRFMDKLRDDILEKHPLIKLTDFDFYDVDVFNQCERQKNVVLVIEKWSCVHPMMKVIPVKWDYAIPFGLLYPTEPSEMIERFLNAVKKVVLCSENAL
ncbi:MAG: LysR family transcriptional regulator [Lachnospiraceae bacterium]|nr:LysR family transcriptional regulator [Ruminococcus sp.]MCM1276578.1 LysR family transcriptional regulator [Lachnospiraceae bacterium]